jgi:hypothetical protein
MTMNDIEFAVLALVQAGNDPEQARATLAAFPEAVGSMAARAAAIEATTRR